MCVCVCVCLFLQMPSYELPLGPAMFLHTMQNLAC